MEARRDNILDKVTKICYNNKQNLGVIFGIFTALLLLNFHFPTEQNTAPMLTITVSHNADGARRYFKDGLSKEGNYYLDQQIKAYWAGKTSTRLGLAGKEVTEEVFSRLVKNLDPYMNGQRLTPRTSDNRRAGVDLTFSAPKSVSLLYSLTKNPKILELHRDAYKKAMLEAEKLMYTQSNTQYARGFTHTGNIAFAAFDHFLSRPTEVVVNEKIVQIADPQLHTHCFIPNVTWNDKAGRYQALEIYSMYMNSDYIRSVYHSELSKNLEKAGFQTERNRSFFELTGISRDLIERFSLRTQEINKISEEKGLSIKQKGELGKKTRNSKSEQSLSDQQLHNYWLDRLTDQELKDLNSLRGKKFDRPCPINVKAAVDRAMENAFERNSVENEKKIIAYAASLGYGHLSIDQIAKELQSRVNILRSQHNTIDNMTTVELVREEDRMIELATSGKGKFPALNKNYEIKLDFLNPQQRKAIQDMLITTDQTFVLRGAAGTGKSTIFSVVNDALRQSGKSLIAVAPSTQASQVLAQKGLESHTIAKLLNDPKVQEKLQNNVLLIDEAGMVGVKNMAQLLALTNKYKSRTILSGDTKQHGPPAQYGDALKILEKQSRLQVSTVDKIERQRNAPVYQSAVQDIAKGRLIEGYQKLNNQGAIIEITDHHQRIERLVQDFDKLHAQKRSTLIVSPTHLEGDKINHAVRELLKKNKKIQGQDKTFEVLRDTSFTNAEKKDPLNYQKGQVIRFTKNQAGGFRAGSHHEVIEISKDEKIKVRDLKTGAIAHLPHQTPAYFNVHTKHNISLAKGDKIRLTNNAMSLQGTKMANGTSYTVKGFNKRGIELSNGKTIPNDLYHLRHGYCDTSFSAQGKDAHTVLVSMSDLSQGGVNEQSFYVGVSRGTKQVKLYTSDKDSLKKSIMRSTDRLSAGDIANDHNQRMLKQKQRAYHEDLNKKISKEREHGREKTASRGISKDHSRG